jgi:tetratricopeptide (TPR) repeat protein
MASVSRTSLGVAFLAGGLVLGCGTALAESAAQNCDDLTSACLLAKAREPIADMSRQLDRDEAHFALTAALAGLGRLDEARHEAAIIENASTRADALGEIVVAAARMGNFDDAFDVAISAADGRFVSAQIEALEALAIEQAARGDIEGAFETVVAIANPYRRSEAQAAIAISVARSGQIADAIRAASRIGMGYWFTSDQNDHKVASGIVARNSEFDHYWFFEALTEIADIQSRAGDFWGAIQTAQAIPDLVGRSRALSRIAAVQADIGDIQAAIETAQMIDLAYGDREALVSIASGMAQHGDFEDALTLARSVQDTYGDGHGLIVLAEHKSRLSLFDDSIQIALEISNIEHADVAWAGIAAEFARNGQLDRANEILTRIPDRNKRFETVLKIVEKLALVGDDPAAMILARQYASPRDLDELTMTIALAVASRGDLDTAWRLAQEIRDGMYRAITLAGMAKHAG